MPTNAILKYYMHLVFLQTFGAFLLSYHLVGPPQLLMTPWQRLHMVETRLWHFLLNYQSTSPTEWPRAQPCLLDVLSSASPSNFKCTRMD